MLGGSLLPNYKYLLNEEDPVPLFALKLLSALTDRSDHFLTSIEKLGILPMVLEYYSFGHKRLNQHTIKVVKNMIDSPEITLETIYEHYIIENTLTIIDNMLDQHQLCYSETLIEILQSIIEKVSSQCEMLETIDGDPNLEKAIENLVTAAFSCMELLDPQYELGVIDKASQCIISILTKFATKNKQNKVADFIGTIYLTEQHFQSMIQALTINSSAIQTRVIQTLSWFLSYTGKSLLCLSMFRLFPLEQKQKNEFDSDVGARFHPFSRPQLDHSFKRPLQDSPSHNILTQINSNIL